MTNPIAYLAHAFGSKPTNLDAAERWLRWLVENVPDVDFCAPWISWCRTLTEGDFRARGLAFDCEMVRRCDQFWLVGLEQTAGMRAELEAARAAGKPIVDLCGFVNHPVQSAAILAAIRAQRKATP